MRKAYIGLAIGTGLMLWLLLITLLPWWVATLMIGLAFGIFWLETSAMVQQWRPQRRNGWQRNALRWTRRDLSEAEPPQWPEPIRRERRD